MTRSSPPGPLAHVGAGSVVDADVVVVGAGVAGLVLALDLAELRPGIRIVVLDKAALGGGSTPLAQGGLAAAVGPRDSARLHAGDTLRAGDGLCDEAAVAVLAAEAPARVSDLIRRGVRFDRLEGGALHLAREGAQTVARCVHAADATGAEMARALRAAVTGPAAAPPLARLQGTACALATASDAAGRSRAFGVWALLDGSEASAISPPQSAGLALVRAGAVVLATGGCGGLYAATTNREGVTGDGVALAYAAGAAVIDCEFVQFHPTGLRTERAGAGRLLLTEALRGAGAVLVDAGGRRFMDSYHADAELAPRHVVARAIIDQPRGAWLDATSLGAERLATEFPTALAGTRAHGFDLAREPVPVEPTQHYLVGGIATDLQGATTLPGLYAVGEAACTGVHGANRMAGNSLAEACVFAHRAALALAAGAPTGAPPPEPEPPALAERPPGNLPEARAELRAAMSGGAGPVRSAGSLEDAAKALDAVEVALGADPVASKEGLELAHARVVARLVVRAARLRAESRGVHCREDAPGRDAAWEGVRIRLQRPAGAASG